MARSNNNLNAVLQDTANAIKAKKEDQTAICPRDFADEIANLPSGPSLEDGLYDISSGEATNLKSKIAFSGVNGDTGAIGDWQGFSHVYYADSVNGSYEIKSIMHPSISNKKVYYLWASNSTGDLTMSNFTMGKYYYANMSGNEPLTEIPEPVTPSGMIRAAINPKRQQIYSGISVANYEECRVVVGTIVPGFSAGVSPTDDALKALQLKWKRRDDVGCRFTLHYDCTADIEETESVHYINVRFFIDGYYDPLFVVDMHDSTNSNDWEWSCGPMVTKPDVLSDLDGYSCFVGLASGVVGERDPYSTKRYQYRFKHTDRVLLIKVNNAPIGFSSEHEIKSFIAPLSGGWIKVRDMLGNFIGQVLSSDAFVEFNYVSGSSSNNNGEYSY